MSRFGSDDFPFQTGDFQVPAVHVPGCRFPIFLGSATSVHPGGGCAAAPSFVMSAVKLEKKAFRP